MEKDTASNLEDLLVQLPTDATLFFGTDHLQHITGQTGNELEAHARQLARAYHCQLTVEDHLESAPGIGGFSFRRC